MCGIVAYIGQKQATPIIIKGLRRLEYRGYDSAGIALIEDSNLNIYKKKGKVSELEHHIQEVSPRSNVGIGHTRWATHGEPNDVNAHPHTSQSGKLAMIHNGIIENYSTVKQKLIKEGFSFDSETDTEVLVNLIEYVKDKNGIKLGIRISIQKSGHITSRCKTCNGIRSISFLNVFNSIS